MYSFSYLEPVCCSISSSNCCFLTCIQVSEEAGQVVWYSHLFQNFPQFIVIHTVKGFGIVNKAEIVFWNSLPSKLTLYVTFVPLVSFPGKVPSHICCIVHPFLMRFCFPLGYGEEDSRAKFLSSSKQSFCPQQLTSGFSL